jgi:hypothetical protein
MVQGLMSSSYFLNPPVTLTVPALGTQMLPYTNQDRESAQRH